MGKKKHKKIRKKGLPPGSLIYTGHHEDSPASVFSVWYTNEAYHARESYAPEWLQQQDGIQWVDVRGLTDTALVEKIGQDFQLHHLALEDVLNTQQRAKLEEYDNSLFFILHNLRLDKESFELQSEQIGVFLGENFVISFQEDSDDTLHFVRKRALEGQGRLRKRSCDYLFYAILDTIVDHYFGVLDELDTTIQELEAELHADGARANLKDRIYDLKRNNNRLRHFILPLRDATNRLYRSDCLLIQEVNRPYLRDLTDHVSQIFDSAEFAREQLSEIAGHYQAEIGNRLNDVMRLLTIISTIFIPLSFIAGVYGMNFEHMPELHWQNGYFIALGIMLAITLTMLTYFRRNKWL
ncbi:MAG: magnesium/cobalt transporter CorA [Saprospiraceae bacterium]|nr:magnesium/cobalt transporter CorA [Lewinellaceae bacterium]